MQHAQTPSNHGIERNHTPNNRRLQEPVQSRVKSAQEELYVIFLFLVTKCIIIPSLIMIRCSLMQTSAYPGSIFYISIH